MKDRPMKNSPAQTICAFGRSQGMLSALEATVGVTEIMALRLSRLNYRIESQADFIHQHPTICYTFMINILEFQNPSTNTGALI